MILSGLEDKTFSRLSFSHPKKTHSFQPIIGPGLIQFTSILLMAGSFHRKGIKFQKFHVYSKKESLRKAFLETKSIFLSTLLVLP